MVGVLIGMSGVGGGVLLLPILIFGLRVPAIVAVGSDALFNFFTKIPASLLHLKKGTVRRKVVLALAVGQHSRLHLRSETADAHPPPLWRRSQQLHQDRRGRAADCDSHAAAVPETESKSTSPIARPTMKCFAGMALIGLVAGFLVGMTSVGSGSIIMMLLLLFYSFPPKVIVGTDIVHAVVLTGVTGLPALPAGERGPRAGRIAADWLHPRRAARFAFGHPRSHALAAPDSVRRAVDHGSPHVVGCDSAS